MVDAKKIEAGSLWRHKKRGSVYRVIDGSAQVQAPEDSGLTDYEVVVVYQSNAGETWVRRHSEFLDGRFEKLSEPPSKEWLTRMAAAEDGHEVGAGATLSLAGEDARLPCHADEVAEIERRLMRDLGYENSHSHKAAFDQFANELHRMWSEDYRSLSLRVEAEKRAREEATEDTRSLCRFILSEWGPDGALKATTYSLEQREARSAKGGDANDSGPSRPIDATSPGVTAGASGEAKQVDPDWFWCEIDPDESGDSAYQAMFTYRPRLEPVELCTSYVGPRLWGVMSPPLPDADNDEETAHTFGTREAAQAFCDERNAIFNGAALCPSEGADRG